MSTARTRPSASLSEVEEIVKDLYGVDTTALLELDSYCDQAFRVTSGDAVHLLKIANPFAHVGGIDLELGIYTHLEGAGLPVQRLVPSRSGASLETCELSMADGSRAACGVRLLTWLEGTSISGVQHHSESLLRDVGATMARLDQALTDLEHPQADRHDSWSSEHAAETVGERLEKIPEGPRREIVIRWRQRFVEKIKPRLSGLRRQVIHGDGNVDNVLAGPLDPTTFERRISGVIDFGDATRAPLVCEVAVAAAYMMMGKSQPLHAAAEVVAGYHAVLPLLEEELEVLYELIRSRLAVSVTMSAAEKEVEPDNAYLISSEAPAWDLLERLDGIDPAWPLAIFRKACGFDASRKTSAVINWLETHRDELAPVTDTDLATESWVADLSVAGSDLWLLPDQLDAAGMWRILSDRLREEGKTVAIGRYDEPRAFYAADQFAVEAGNPSERRTVHLGIDLFAPAGTPVYTPLDGIVESFTDNAYELDYGPTILLRHEVTDEAGAELVFHTLWGHLSRESLDGLEEGQRIVKGARVATLGDLDVNGGWAPHLHLQLIVELLGERGTYPGVASPKERPVWLDLCPDPNRLVGVPNSLFPAPETPAEVIHEERTRRIGPNLSLSYTSPLHIVRGKGQYLFDAWGRAYLDVVNNVAHVGHCHPRVVRAAQRQMTVLNTNTRYLHAHLTRYAERLAETLPEPLSVCFFVNSGSEANDLALRLARAYTGGTDAVVVDGAYHGHTGELIGLSPYKHDGPGGQGAPEHVRKTPMPDPYRGQHRLASALPGSSGRDPVARARAERELGERYAAHVGEAFGAILAEDRRPAAFFCESILSCGGQIVPPAGYLEAAYAHARAAGATVIADEVQVGFGRVGSHFWAFEALGDAVPDIVTLGKPIGNGHPLSAVVTTPEIAAALAGGSAGGGMEYFNTFGGNPVSCAVGLAVLDVIEEEGLRENALEVGGVLLEGLRGLAERHELVGDARGLGLFVGIELVEDQTSLEPAARQAAYAVERAKQRGILLSTDGPFYNVIKMKPPLVFTTADAERVVAVLDDVLGEDGARMTS